MIFGFLGISNQNIHQPLRLRKNLNNLSDGMLMGLLLFGIIPHVFKHWTESISLLAVYLIMPGVLALFIGHFLKRFQNIITLWTAVIFLFHSFVEGIAIGTSFTSQNFALILASLLVHKAIECFCFSNQIQQVSDHIFFTSFFVILNALTVMLSFHYGISLKENLFWLDNAETYCDLLTATSLLFLIVFCSQIQHDKTCSHIWNRYNFIGTFLSMVLILSFAH
jgi:hypothetical protein